MGATVVVCTFYLNYIVIKMFPRAGSYNSCNETMVQASVTETSTGYFRIYLPICPPSAGPLPVVTPYWVLLPSHWGQSKQSPNWCPQLQSPHHVAPFTQKAFHGF